jgi:hypothetical protein
MPDVFEIVVLSPFLMHEFDLPSFQISRDLLHLYQIELIHLNFNSIPFSRFFSIFSFPILALASWERRGVGVPETTV